MFGIWNCTIWKTFGIVQFGNEISKCFPKNENLEIVKLNAKYEL
jgi:hypothetical protein